MRADAKGRTRDSRRKVKADCRADTRGGPWAGIPVCVINSPAYRDLSLHARAVLVELTARMNGYNNGDIAVSQRDLSKALRCTPRYVVSALTELAEHGLIDVAAEGQWKARIARQYRLTFVSMKAGPATNDYLHWRPTEKSGASHGETGKGKSASYGEAERTHPASYGEAGAAPKPRKSVDRANQPASHGEALIDNHTHTANVDSKLAPVSPSQPAGASQHAGGLGGGCSMPNIIVAAPTPAVLQASADAPNRILATIQERWPRLAREDREAVARQHGVSPGEIDQACAGTGGLLFPKLVAIRSTLTTWRTAA